MTPDSNGYFLREIEAGDLAEINDWRNDATLVESLGAPFRYVNEAVDRAWFDHYMANRSTAVRLAVCEPVGRKTVGVVYLTGIDWVARSGEFSIWIAALAHRAKGAGTAAARGMLRHAFLDLNLHRVHLTVLADNEVARSLYRRLGFVEEGRLRGAAFKNGQFVDLVQMAMLSDEYRE